MTAAFTLPDPLAPKFVTRDLTLARGLKNGRRQAPLRLRGVRLIVLIPHCLYEVPPDCHEQAGKEKELRPGCILSRNLELSTHLAGRPVEEQIEEVFRSFDGVYKARRGLGKIDRRYHSREIPVNRKLTGELDELIRLSWELKRVDVDGIATYELVAVRAAQTYAKAPINEHKRKAKERTLQAGTVQDTSDRFNPGRIPLICVAGRNQATKRIEEVRRIGRRMSLREAVLEHYIDRLQEVVRDVRMSQQYRLGSKWLKSDESRTPRKVREEAQQLIVAAERLRRIYARPFSRSLLNSAKDLEEAARILRQCADESDPSSFPVARYEISKVFRAMLQVECHMRLEEVLLQATVWQDRKQLDVSQVQERAWVDELYDVHLLLTSTEPVTGQMLEHGFRRKVLPWVTPYIQLAIAHLMRPDLDGGPNIPEMVDALRHAVEPL